MAGLSLFPMVKDFVELLVAAAGELVGGPPNRPAGETTLPVQPTQFGWIRRDLTRKTGDPSCLTS